MAFLNKSSTDVLGVAQTKMEEIKGLIKPEMTAEDKGKVEALTGEVKALKAEASQLSELEKLAAEIKGDSAERPGAMSTPVPKGGPGSFKSAGDFIRSVYYARRKGVYDPRLGKAFRDDNEPDVPDTKGWSESNALEHKDLVENVGASGGFLVPVQQQTELLQVPGPEIVFRPRATVVPMARRQIQWPTLDQTNTTVGRPAWYGGVLANWTEEEGYKDETQPAFKQINLVAHKLCCYTEASDELIEDSAISLVALLSSLFNGAVNWYEEDAFITGSGAGQPLGIAHPNCTATFVQARAVAGTIRIDDIINMLEHFHGSNPIWLISRRCLPTLMQLAGPIGSAAPSYVFMPNARDGMPGTLFGYPIFWNEHCPTLGNRGDIILADLKMYLIGDRKATAIDADRSYRFRYDITSWRAVHRVDGQPWLSQPIQWADGTVQVSPFVVLDGAGAT